jgi:hypothetical protein
MFLFVLVVLLAKVRKNGQSTKYLEAFPSAIVLVVARSDEGKEQKKEKRRAMPSPFRYRQFKSPNQWLKHLTLQPMRHQDH